MKLILLFPLYACSFIKIRKHLCTSHFPKNNVKNDPKIDIFSFVKDLKKKPFQSLN